ncbi:MAG: hypothetical protein QOH87_2294, partial [Trebonia sp.]|nr:hypothetical protein [Trebonia sp.]
MYFDMSIAADSLAARRGAVCGTITDERLG